MKYTYKIANHIIVIDSLYEEIHNLCIDYKYSANYEDNVIFIKTNQEDIEFERQATIKEFIHENIDPYEFEDSKYELSAVYRKLAKELLSDNIILCHGSVVSIDNQAYMFIAKSGTGKSTHTRMWREVFKDKAVMVNDDKPLIEIKDKQIIAYGTPWNGKHHLGNNISIPLKSIVILERGIDNEIHEVSKMEAFPKLLQQTNRIPNKEDMECIIKLVDTLASNVKLYRMKCNISHEAALMAYEKMK